MWQALVRERPARKPPTILTAIWRERFRLKTAGLYLIYHEPYYKVKGKTRPRTGHEGPEVQLYSFFNLGTRWGWEVKAAHRPLYSREWPGTHYTGGRVGPWAGLNGYWKPRPHQDSIPGTSSPQPVPTPTELCRPTWTVLLFKCM